MQHLYHEQTNTISSRSTSSSSSKHSKSNDTTSSNLFQLSSPQSNIPPILCFRNPNVSNDQMDYHVYETIPSENILHSAFKPVVQSNTHTIRPYQPRTNVLYHYPDSSKQIYNTLSPNMTVVMPVYCHQCSTGTLRQPIPPPTSSAQIYARSESIV